MPRLKRFKRDASTNEYLVALRTKLYSLETEMLRNGMEVTIDTFIDAFKNKMGEFESNAKEQMQQMMNDMINKGGSQ